MHIATMSKAMFEHTVYPRISINSARVMLWFGLITQYSLRDN